MRLPLTVMQQALEAGKAGLSRGAKAKRTFRSLSAEQTVRSRTICDELGYGNQNPSPEVIRKIKHAGVER